MFCLNVFLFIFQQFLYVSVYLGYIISHAPYLNHRNNIKYAYGSNY